jgi:DNA-binding NarL/FixJ family response regulator
VDDDAVSVLLVEDNHVYREALVFLLGQTVGVEVVGAVGTGEAAAPACVELSPDVAVVDFRLPDVDGAEVASQIRERAPRTVVVFLSASAGHEEAEAARIAGAPLVRKDEGVDALVGAIRAAAGSEDT